MITRRVFLGQSAACGAALLAPAHAWKWPDTTAVDLLSAPLLNAAPDEILITILHTNDTHSQIEPLPKNDRSYPDKGVVSALRCSAVAQAESAHAVDAPVMPFFAIFQHYRAKLNTRRYPRLATMWQS
jgi:2',3'-cyclic-nucleotide 2'-phosphodiesterase (5'-nucleotidase family)